MVAEILICHAIAFAIMLCFGLIIKVCLWLYKTKGIPLELSILIITSFVVITLVVGLARSSIRESKENELKRRRI